MSSRTAKMEILTAAFLGAFAIAFFADQAYAAQRLVVLKFDGLPQAIVDEYVAKIDPKTGRSCLPWIKRLFYDEGIRLANFYTRGLTLSAPAWVILDSGRLPVIRGNVEFNRLSGRVDDYLNYSLYYWEKLHSSRVEPYIMEILEDAGIALFSDLFAEDIKHTSPQLVQRNGRWIDLARPLARIASPSLRRKVEDVVIGVDAKELFLEGSASALISKLADERKDYLDLYSPIFDKKIHNENSPEAILETLREIDSLVGRIYQAIRSSRRASETILVLVSDHGLNTNPNFYSQGFNLGNYLRRAEFGGHHLLTKREILSSYSLRSLNPLTTSVINESEQSSYLRGKKGYYTAILDFDGNERAALHLRNSDLNLLHLILIDLRAGRHDRDELVKAALAVIGRWRPIWEREAAELAEELEALRRQSERYRALIKATTKDPDLKRRLKTRLLRLSGDRKRYLKYRDMILRLLALKEEDLRLGRIKPEDAIPPGVLGARNNIYQLRNYIVGRGANGELQTLDYFLALKSYKALNNIREGVSSHPVDFLAARIPYLDIAPTIAGSDLDTGQDLIWLYGGEQSQALIVPRLKEGKLQLKYVPIAELRQRRDGRILFRRVAFRPDLPLRIWEDENFKVAGAKEEWLSNFHSEEEWRQAMHQAKYCLAIIGLYDLFSDCHLERLKSSDGPDGPLLDRFWRRMRSDTEPDLHIFASDGWNFDVKDFNPGGNHGGFFRASAHSVFMLWGGADTGLKRGVKIDTPYDSLSFVPTLLALLGRSDALFQRSAELGNARLPGRVVREIFSGPQLIKAGDAEDSAALASPR